MYNPEDTNVQCPVCIMIGRVQLRPSSSKVTVASTIQRNTCSKVSTSPALHNLSCFRFKYSINLNLNLQLVCK
jgi:hypothetical protein